MIRTFTQFFKADGGAGVRQNWRTGGYGLLFTLLSLVGISSATAQYVNIPVTGYNNDIIANGVGTGTAVPGVTYPGLGLDGAGYYFIDGTYKYAAANALPTCSLPANLLIPSTLTSGLTYTLQSYSGNNAMTIDANSTAYTAASASYFSNSGTMTLVTPASYSKLYVLYETVIGGSNAFYNVTVTFTDASTQVFNGNSFVNWFTNTGTAYPPATSAISRTDNSGVLNACTAASGPYLFEAQLALSPSNYGKQVQSITISLPLSSGAIASGSNNYFHAMAVGGQTFCSAPSNQATAYTPGTITSSSIAASFTAAASAPTGYLVVRYPSGATATNPSNGTTYTTGQALGLGTVVQFGATTSFTATGLAGATNYDFYIYDYNTGTTCGGPIYNTTSPLVGTTMTGACGSMSGTYSVGPTGTYPTLTAAAAALSTNGMSGAVVLELQAAYTSGSETFPISLGLYSCASAVNTLTIRPEAGATALTIANAANASPVFNLNGANYVVIDGRPGGSGSVSQLTIANNFVGASSAIQFVNDASNNTVKYCTVKSAGNVATTGTIVFSTGTVTGNDNNTIDNCDINESTSGSPVNGIYSFGTSALVDNSNNSITNNRISNYFNAALATVGILVGSTGNHAWTITGNRLFQTANRVYTTAQTHNGIAVLSGSGYTISNNIIGYANAAGTGTTNMMGNTVALTGTFPSSYTTTGTANATRYIGINAAFTSLGTVSNIQGNTIGGFALYTSSGATTTNGILCGINVTSGTVNIGTTTGNTIGATTGNGSIYTVCTTTQGTVVGIYTTSAAGNTVSIQNNTIGAIDAMGNGVTATSVIGAVTGIDVAGAANYTISSNFVGNTTADNIRTGAMFTGSNLSNVGTFGSINPTSLGHIVGIRSAMTGNSLSITNNTLRGWATAGTTSAITGITSSGAMTLANPTANIDNNFLGTATLGWVKYYNPVTANSGTLLGISLTNTVALTHSIQNNDFRGITYSNTAIPCTGTHTYITLTGATAAGNVATIANNTFNNLSVNTTGTITFMSHSYLVAATGTQTINNNSIVTAFTRMATATSGAITLSTSGSSSTAGAVINHTNNNFSNITISGTATISGWVSSDGGTANKTYSNNTFANWTSGTGAMTAMSISFGGGAGGTGNLISNNTITNFSGGGAITGIAIGASGTAATVTGNSISGLASSGAALVVGITSAAPTSGTIYKNKIYNLSNTNATGTVTGIAITGGALHNVYNNLIGNLTVTTAAGANIVNGINITGGTAVNAYYNTVYLTGTSSGATFGSSALSAATATTLTLRNNILVNNTTPTGGAYGVAYRRSSTTLTSHGSASDNNLFASTPSVMYDGTSAYDITGFQTLLAGAREANSFTETVSNTPGTYFQSFTGSASTFLHLVSGLSTRCESGAANISSPAITDDFDGDIRQGNTGYSGAGSSPDVGADEFAGVSPAPAIFFTSATPALTSQCTASQRDIVLTITPGAGSITAANIVYNNGAGAQGPFPMTAGASNTWSYTIPVASPTNSSVTWGVTATNSVGLSKGYTGTSYSDEPLAAFAVSATATPTAMCMGGTATLTASISASGIPSGSIPPTYTAPPAVTNATTDEDLGNITITQGATTILNNTTAINSLVGTIGTATGTAGSYSDFTAFGPYLLLPNTTYNLSLSSLQATTAYGNAIAVFIDYNRNGVFTDAGEQIYNQGATIAGAHTVTSTFTVPATVVGGKTRMRVFVNEGTITGPTQTASYGEYEEYMILLPPVFTYAWASGPDNGTGNPASVAVSALPASFVVTASSGGCSLTATANTIAPAPPLNPMATVNAVSTTICEGATTALSSSAVDGCPAYTYSWDIDIPGGGSFSNINIANPVFTGLLAGSYVLTCYITDANSDVASNTINMTVNPKPSATIAPTPSNAAICGTGSVVLDVAAGATTYAWTPATGLSATNTSNVTATPTTTTTYNVTVTGANGCTASSSQTVTVSSGVVMSSVTATPASICNGANSTLTALANYTPGNTSGLTYCASTHASGCSGDNIANVVLNTISNATGTACGGTSHYTYFTGGGTQTTSLTGNSTYSLSLTFGTDGNQYFGAWIDYNQDGTFATTEFLGASGNAGASGTTSVSFTVPNSALNGVSRLRIVGGNDAAVTSSQACGASSSGFGETQDYNVTITGGTPPPLTGGTYAWSPATFLSSTSGATVTANAVTATTTYTVTATSPAGCQATGNVTLTAGSPISCNSLSVSGATACVGVQTVTAAPTGGGAPYSYSWTEDGVGIAATTASISPSAGTHTYVCIVTDNCGTSCTTAGLAVTTYANPTVTVSASATAYCTPGTAVTLTTGGTSGLSYAWSPSTGLSATTGASVAATPSASTTYTVTGTDGNGCLASATKAVAFGYTITLGSVTATPAAVCNGGNSVLAASATTSAPATTYCTPANTSYDGTDMIATMAIKDATGATTLYSRTSAATPLPCYDNQTALTTTTLTAGTSYQISLTIGSSGENLAAFIDFNGNGVFTDAGETIMASSATVANGTSTATFTVPVGAYNGTSVRLRCVAQYSSAASSCSTSGYGETEDYQVSITGGASSPTALSYAWSPATYLSSTSGTSVTATAVASPQTYTVTASSAAGCSASGTVGVTVNPLPTATISGTTTVCQSSTAPNITFTGATGTAPYTFTYKINGGSNLTATTVSGNSVTVAAPTTTAGTFTYTLVSVADANTCSQAQTGSAAVTVNPTPTTTASATAVSCNGGTNGTVTATAAVNGTAPYTYTWNTIPQQTGLSATTLAAGTYAVTAIDANGCTATANATVTQPTALSASSTTGTIDCFGGSTTVTVSAAGGTTPYTGTGAMTSPAGAYTYTVTDANGCTATTTGSISQPTQLVVTAGSNSPICEGATLNLTSSATGGTTPYFSYTWTGTAAYNSQNPTISNASNLLEGAYTVTVVDDKGCTASANITVNINDIPVTPTISASSLFFCSGATSTLTSSYTGAGNNWSTGATTDNITVSAGGNYTVSYTDVNGCVSANGSISLDLLTPTNRTIPTTAGTHYANNACYDGSAWTYFYENDKLLLAVEMGNTWNPGSLVQATPGAGQYAVRVDVGATMVADLTTAPYNDSTNGGYGSGRPWKVINRTWDLQLFATSQEPSDSVSVKTYFTEAEYLAVNGSFINPADQLSGPSQMTVYKLNRVSQPWSSLYANSMAALSATHAGIDSSKITLYNNLTPYMTHWLYTGNNPSTGIHTAQLKVAEFSGGGGGGGAGGGSPFAVELAYFDGHNQGNSNLLNWVTLSELSNRAFEVQRSVDGISFQTIGTVNTKAANGTSSNPISYEFVDMKPAKNSYYRLKQIDIDGSVNMLPKVVEISLTDNFKTAINVFPNPASSELNVAITGSTFDTYLVEVCDIYGRAIASTQQLSNGGTTISTINVKDLAQGTYIVTVKDRTNSIVSTQRFIKE